jgi:hypothetical protein
MPESQLVASTLPTRSGDSFGPNDLLGLLDRGLNQLERSNKFLPAGEKSAHAWYGGACFLELTIKLCR